MLINIKASLLCFAMISWWTCLESGVGSGWKEEYYVWSMSKGCQHGFGCDDNSSSFSHLLFGEMVISYTAHFANSKVTLIVTALCHMIWSIYTNLHIWLQSRMQLDALEMVWAWRRDEVEKAAEEMEQGLDWWAALVPSTIPLLFRQPVISINYQHGVRET